MEPQANHKRRWIWQPSISQARTSICKKITDTLHPKKHRRQRLHFNYQQFSLVNFSIVLHDTLKYCNANGQCSFSFNPNIFLYIFTLFYLLFFCFSLPLLFFFSPPSFYLCFYSASFYLNFFFIRHALLYSPFNFSSSYCLT